MKTTTHLAANPYKAIVAMPFAGLLLLISVNNAMADIKTDADSIFNWGEGVLPALMSSHQPTQQFDKYWYRAYAATDFYAAINAEDNRVYYGSIAAFLNGVKPTFYKSVADTLADVAASKPTSGTSCDISKLPAGYKVTQTGDTVKMVTDGCIPEPKTTPDYCPQFAKENGISKKSTMTLSSASVGGTLIMCVKNAAPDNIRVIELDICYSTGRYANQRLQSKIVSEEVADCFKTDAVGVSDAFTGEVWIKIDGVFQSIKPPKK